MSKLMTAEEAVKLIKDGDAIGIGGFIGMGHPQELSIAIENSFKETGHPRELTVMFSAGVGDGTDKLGVNHLGHERFIKTNYCRSLGIDPDFSKISIRK